MSRFGRALVAAVLLHAGLVLVVSRTSPKRDAGVASRPTELEVEWLPDEERSPEPPPPEPLPEPLPEPTPTDRAEPSPEPSVVVQRPPEALETRRRGEPSASEGARGDSQEAGVVALEGSGSGEARAGGSGDGEGAPAKKIDLGLDGRLLTLDAARRGEASDLPSRRLQQSLEADISARDVALGLARGGPLVRPLSVAARERGPTRGSAVFRITTDARGGIIDVELVSGLTTEWSRALSLLRERLRGTLLRVPPGTRGVAVTLEVLARVQRPSGAKVEDGAISVRRKDASVQGSFDFANLSGNEQRVVHTRIVSEEIIRD
ncbi:MAG: hypothetical protein DIU78_020345 [Pseudomonadota bacterium]